MLALAIDEEIENHILERTERLVEQGMSARDARREAERRFGSVRRVRRALEGIGGDTGHGGGGEGWRSWLRDLAQGGRLARRSPGFAFAVVATIGLGVGANAAVFSVTDAVLLRPLPFEDPDELVAIEAYLPESDRSLDRMEVQRALTWRASAPPLDGLVVFSRVNMIRTGIDDPHSVWTFAVTDNWLTVLGARPALGRVFTAEESAVNASPTIVLGHSLWLERFGGDASVVGSTIELDGRAYTVIGVMPAGFKFPVLGPADAWVALRDDGTYDGVTPLEYASVMVRRPDQMGLEAVQERFDAVTSGLQAANPRADGWRVRARPFDNFRANADLERALWILTVAVGVMLLIAIVNATNLFLARVSARRGEMALRAALGASRGRLVRQQVTENFVLITAGGLLALVLARVMLDSIVAMLPDEVTVFLTSDIALDRRVLAFAFAVTVLAGLLLSVLPALRGARGAHGAGHRASASRSGSWVRNTLVIAEVAMTVTLLVAAGLLVNSFVRLTAVDPGYDPGELVQLSLLLPDERYPHTEARRLFFDRLRERLATLPAVSSVSLADGVPPGAGFSSGIAPQAEGEAPKELPQLLLPHARVDAHFFRTLGTPIVAGRGFTVEDTRESGHVIVDRDMARFLWGDASPVGRRFRVDDDDERPWLTVIGVVDDLKLMGQDDRHGTLDLFHPLPPGSAREFMSVVLRTVTEPEAVLPAVRGVVRDLDPGLPIYRLQTGEQALADANENPRFFLLMMANFSAVALGLAVIGTYGVLAFVVRQRRRELGVRVVLGARAGQLQHMVLRQGLGLALIGVVLGSLGALALGRAARSMLFEVEPTDPLTFAAVAAVMLGCAALASWLPARRATRVDPLEVLRAE